MKPTRRIGSRIRLTLAGVYWLLASASFAAIGIYKSINLILVLSYFLLVLLLGNWWVVRKSLRHLRAQVDLFEDGFVGESRRIRCWVESSSNRKLRGLQIKVRLARQENRWYLPVLKGKTPVLLTRLIPLPFRGVFTDGEVILCHSFPFGLVENTTVIPIDRTVAIYPERGFVDLARLLRRVGSGAAVRGQHRAAVRQLADGTDLHGLRPLRPGDSPRWIHWRTTARIGELMVREFDRATGPSLTAIVVPAESQLEFEQQLSCVATIVWEWTRRQDGRLRIWIRLAKDWELWELDHRRRATDLLRRLAEAQFVESASPQLPDAPTRGPIVYIGSAGQTSVDDNDSEWIDQTQSGDVYRPPVLES